MIQTHCEVCGASIVSLITDSAELHGCPVDEPGHFLAQVERESEATQQSIPETLPISGFDICYNGVCGNRVEFENGSGYCSKCGIHQRYVEASAEFIQSVIGHANVFSFVARV